MGSKLLYCPRHTVGAMAAEHNSYGTCDVTNFRRKLEKKLKQTLFGDNTYFTVIISIKKGILYLF